MTRRETAARLRGRGMRMAVGALALCVLTATWPAAIAAQEKTKPFKPFKLKTLDGAPKALADVLAPATVVVFFFPTCKYCNEAFPHVQRLYDTYKDKGLSMVWINAVPKEQKLIADWQTKHGYSVPVLVGASQAALQRDYDLELTPSYYLLNAKGEVVVRHNGYKAGDEVALERRIQSALGESH